MTVTVRTASVPAGHTPAAALSVAEPAASVPTLTARAVEAALDRALRRRLPGLLDQGLDSALAPLSGEVATAFADVEMSAQRVAEAEERAHVAESALAAAQDRLAALERQVGALQARPVGLFRRRRPAGVATA